MDVQTRTDMTRAERNRRKDIAISAGFGASLGSLVWAAVFSPTGMLNWHEDEWAAFVGGVAVGVLWHFLVHPLQRPPAWVQRWRAKRGLPPAPEIRLVRPLPHEVRLGRRVFRGALVTALVGLAAEVFVHATAEKIGNVFGALLVFMPAATVTWYWMDSDERRSPQTALFGLSIGAISSLPVAVLLAVLVPPGPVIALAVLTLFSIFGFAGGLAIDRGWASREALRSMVTGGTSAPSPGAGILLSLLVASVAWFVLMKVFSIASSALYAALIAVGWGLGFFPWFLGFSRWFLYFRWGERVQQTTPQPPDPQATEAGAPPRPLAR